MAKEIERRSLLSSDSWVQVPFINVTIGDYTFGAFSATSKTDKDAQGYYTAYNQVYPNYVQNLNITKINGQVNTYQLQLSYPVTPEDDPNFFEKVLSSVSSSRKIIFSYGDWSRPTYIYRNEEAIITKVFTSFNFGNNGEMSSVITYNIDAISTATFGLSGTYTFNNPNGELKVPSDEIKRILNDNSTYGLLDIFTGMKGIDIENFIDGGDKKVQLETKTNISALDYISYLVSCMIPKGTVEGNISKDMYILTLHDDSTKINGSSTYEALIDRKIVDDKTITGPYFEVTRTSYLKEQSDAYEIDIGFNTNTIVTNFAIENNENYSMYYDYQNKLELPVYSRRINDKGEWEDVYAPGITSRNQNFMTNPEDITWWTKITKYPIKANITIQGLLRPATLMQYVRLNVIFPGGHKHISSGLYIVTKQQDSLSLSGNGFRTNLSLTKISGDSELDEYIKNGG